MASRKKLYERIRRNQHNVRFTDLVRVVEGFGFEHHRTQGSHHMFVHPEIREGLNLQEDRGEAKAYQVRQFLGKVKRYNLKPGKER